MSAITENAEWHVIQTVSDQAISGQITCPRPLFTVNVNTPVIFRNRISCGRYLSASLGIFGRAGGGVCCRAVGCVSDSGAAGGQIQRIANAAGLD